MRPIMVLVAGAVAALTLGCEESARPTGAAEPGLTGSRGGYGASALALAGERDDLCTELAAVHLTPSQVA